jgi:putative addiction module killer protein
MLEIRRTEIFDRWLRKLKDQRAKATVAVRLRRMALGNFGDVAPVGDGVSELRIHFGPGYRVYFTQRGETVIILLCGGDKGTQSRDIASAKKLANELKV